MVLVLQAFFSFLSVCPQFSLHMYYFLVLLHYTDNPNRAKAQANNRKNTFYKYTLSNLPVVCLLVFPVEENPIQLAIHLLSYKSQRENTLLLVFL